MPRATLVGLDIGTGTLKAAVAENRGGRPHLSALFRESSAGLRKGTVADVAEISSALSRLLAEVRKVSRACLKTVYVNIGTPQSKTQGSHGVVAVSRADSEIYQDDIDRVIKASQAVSLAPNRLVLHNVTREYLVDGVGDIVDPLGLSGNRLEVSSILVDAFAPHVKSVVRAVELAGASAAGLVFDPLVGSRAALSKNQKELGTLLVDIGAGTTSLAVYEENKLVDIFVFPVGAGHITNDLAVGLKIPVAAAERLKLECGCAVPKEVSPKEMVELGKFAPEAKGAVSRRFIAEIIESRLAEIFEFIDNRLKSVGRQAALPGGVVLVGGGAKLPGLAELAKQELRLTSQIGFVLGEEWAKEETPCQDALEDPECVNVLGLVLWGAEKEGWAKNGHGSLWHPKQILRYFLP